MPARLTGTWAPCRDGFAADGLACWRCYAAATPQERARLYSYERRLVGTSGDGSRLGPGGWEVVRVSGAGAELVWLSPETIEEAGVSGWTELPIWVPPTGELSSLHDSDTTKAHEAGLRCRPMPETVADTWAWLQAEGYPVGSARAGTGLDAEGEARLWAVAEARGELASER